MAPRIGSLCQSLPPRSRTATAEVAAAGPAPRRSPGGHTSPRRPRCRLLSRDRGQARNGAGRRRRPASAASPAVPRVRPRDAAQRQGKNSLPGKRESRGERSSRGWLWLIFSKIDTQAGKAKWETGGTTSSFAAPNVAPARNSGTGWRQVQALAASALGRPCETIGSPREDCPDGLFPTEPIYSTSDCQQLLFNFNWTMPYWLWLLLYDKERNAIPLFLWKRTLGKSDCTVPSCPSPARAPSAAAADESM